MSEATQIDLQQELANEKLTWEELELIKQQVYSDKDLFKSLEALHFDWQEGDIHVRQRLRACWIFNDFATLAQETGQSVGVDGLVRARSLLALGKAAEAAELFAELSRAGKEKLAASIGLVEAALMAGDLSMVEKTMAKLQKKHEDSAGVHHARGLWQDRVGDYLGAMDSYEKALELDEEHAGAMFRLAYNRDLRGDDEAAISLYERCAELQPTYVNCLLNLGVLYEDDNDYDKAMNCYRQVLDVNPNHPRARLFLKDAQSSLEMYFDEDHARMKDRENLILSIPVTDFELSVRSRNCLNKMNIRTLGCLCQKTETELLSYKNFGETSLMEIKEILAKKGLKLGQGRLSESVVPSGPMSVNPLTAVSGEAGKTVIEIDFSVRVRTALKTLNLHTLGDLAARSSRELVSCKNFGQTSLDEVRQILAKYGLSLADEPN